jgi:hypothetical protein
VETGIKLAVNSVLAWQKSDTAWGQNLTSLPVF